LDRFQQITLLGKLIFYDRELSVKRNEACSFCHMPETGFSARQVISTRRLLSTPARFGRAFPDKSLSLKLMRVTHRFFITMRSKVTLSAASSGTCAPPDFAWTATA
jgi:hypothetical protein